MSIIENLAKADKMHETRTRVAATMGPVTVLPQTMAERVVLETEADQPDSSTHRGPSGRYTVVPKTNQ